MSCSHSTTYDNSHSVFRNFLQAPLSVRLERFYCICVYVHMYIRTYVHAYVRMYVCFVCDLYMIVCLVCLGFVWLLYCVLLRTYVHALILHVHLR